jgi:hypothetical protein
MHKIKCRIYRGLVISKLEPDKKELLFGFDTPDVQFQTSLDDLEKIK